MSALQWVSVGFAGAILAFLMWLVARDTPLKHQQFVILRFICAIGAGFAAALFTGETFFSGEGTWGGAKLAVSGTAGFGLFLLVWLTFDKQVPQEGDIAISIPEGWTFRQAVDVLAERDNATVVFSGFTPDELDAPLQPRSLRARSLPRLIELLGELRMMPTARSYGVRRDDGRYVLETKPSAAQV